MGEKESR